ncbi:hypothetical protein D3C85_1305460 [compost metagenome]
MPAHADQRRRVMGSQGHLPGRAVNAKRLVEQAKAIQIRIVIEAVAHNQVDTGVLMQIDNFAMGVQAQADVGVSGIETTQARHQPQGGKGGGGGNCQVRAAAVRAQGVDALRHFQERAVQAVKQALAAFGQAYLAR